LDIFYVFGEGGLLYSEVFPFTIAKEGENVWGKKLHEEEGRD
jgi:hypothetical protein